MKRWYIVLFIFFAVILAIPFRPQLQGTIDSLILKSRGQATVADRFAQYGELARKKLRPFFDAKGIAYPPEKLIFVGLKAEKELEIYAADKLGEFAFIRSYPIFATSGTTGPKLREGDKQVPEGLYKIEFLHPNSWFHLALKLNYPNRFDHRQGKKEGRTNLGGDIMIHGSTASIGCLAMGDSAIEELFVLAADTGIGNIAVILTPIDFRTAELPTDEIELPSWTEELYKTIREKLNQLPKEKL